VTAGPDLNPLNSPSAGELLGADWGPGAIPGTLMGGNVVSRTQGGPRAKIPLKTRYDMLRTQMDAERESWRAHILDLKNNFLPYRTRWLDDGGNPNLGNKKTQYIVDNTPPLALRTLASGLMSSVTNPARPWIRIKPHDDQLLEAEGVPEWCEAVTNGVLGIFRRSNYYDTMEPLYREIGGFGTCAQDGVEIPWDPKFPDRPVMRYVAYTWGEYWISQDSSGVVNRFMRSFKWTAKQIVDRFVDDPLDQNDPKWRNIAPATRALWMNRTDERRMEVMQVVEENDEHIPGSPLAKDFKYRSVFYERGGNPNQILEISGRRFMPHIARWDLNTDDSWGHSPAMDCLGDAKSLQVQHKRKAQAIDKLVDPPLIGDSNLKKTRVSMLPGDVTWLEGATANSFGMKPLYEVKPELSPMLEDIKDMRQRIQASMYTDVFQMLKTMGEELKSGITATEIQARVQERILEMGPVLTRLNNELYTKQIEQALEVGVRRSRLAWQYMNSGRPVPPGVEMIFPPPPRALRGKELKIEYISILAQAQRMDEINSIQKLITYVLGTVAVKPDVLDKINFDRTVDLLADRMAVPPEVIVRTEIAEKFRKARADQAAQEKKQAAQQAAVQTGAQAIKNLGAAPLGSGNALEHLVGATPAGNA
jgi:hypothetical protein